MRPSNVIRHIEHIASLPLTPHIVIPEMLRALDGVVPGGGPGFFWIDDSGAILDAYAPSAHVDQVAPTCRQWASRCGDRRDGTGAAFHYRADGGFHISFRIGGALKAILSMQRAARVAGFTERERRILATLAPCFGRALVASEDGRQVYDDVADRVGVAIASADGRLVSADPEALRLLLEMTDQPLVPGVAPLTIDQQLPPYLLDLIRRAGTAPAAPAQIQRSARWGVYRARAFLQYGPQYGPQFGFAGSTAPVHAILVSRHLPRIVRLMRTIATCDLSPRERQATYQLGIGADSAAAAAALGVSILTWRSYVKRVYQRLDVRDRIELMGYLGGAARA